MIFYVVCAIHTVDACEILQLKTVDHPMISAHDPTEVVENLQQQRVAAVEEEGSRGLALGHGIMGFPARKMGATPFARWRVFVNGKIL